MTALTNLNGDWYSTLFYFVVLTQIVVTTVIAPMLLIKHYTNRIDNLPHNSDIMDSAKKFMLAYQVSIAAVLAFLISIAIQAISKNQELFNWDNQSGLTIMFLLAYLPITFLFFLEKKLNTPTTSTRSASLKRQTWRDFIPTYALILLAVGNLLFLAATGYYTINPFEGFGGIFNVVGLVFLNSVMATTVYVCMNGRHFQNIEDPIKRANAKQLTISVNLFIWILALFHLTTSLVLAGQNLREYSLLFQSVYFQVIFVATIQIFCKKDKQLDSANR